MEKHDQLEVNELIEACKKQHPKAQRIFYERYSSKMFGICLRYTGNKADAQDVLLKGMYKALSRLDQYDEKGHFEGWLRRIFINESLMWLRKQKRRPHKTEVEPHHARTRTTAVDNLALEDILHVLDQLPPGYRTVFNLYVIEGYKHREIAEKLDISINTSKSQLLLARKKIIQILEDMKYPGIHKRKSE